NETFVYVIGNGKAVKKKIETGITDGVKIQVISGLNPGDEFIMGGKYTIREGMDVTIAGQGPPKGLMPEKGQKGQGKMPEGKKPEDSFGKDRSGGGR
ncbi:MAG: hypothetical protein ACPL7B_15145, partial [Candidatus Poribacteria bacterium]